jgi:hypothetical protein
LPEPERARLDVHTSSSRWILAACLDEPTHEGKN